MFNLQMIWAVTKKEFRGYFLVPDAYVVITIFLILTGLYGFMIGDFLPNDDASLAGFLDGHRWVYLILVPALGMQMWSEERRSGTLELLFTLPIREWECVIGKFLAGMGVVISALILTFPTVITVCYLGSPDLGMIVCGYFGSICVAASYLALSSLASALSRNQVISYVLGAAACLAINLCGLQALSDLFSGVLEPIGDFLNGLGIRPHYQSFLRGIPDTRDLYYFAAVTTFGLFATMTVLWVRRSGGMGHLLSRLNGQPGGTEGRSENTQRTLIYSGGGLGILVIILLLLGCVMTHFHLRIDLTEGNMFTLSQSTQSIVKGIQTPVEIRFYLSRDRLSKWNAIQGYAKRVEDLLNEFAALDPHRLRVEKLDVIPRSAAEESAAVDGIRGVQVEGIGQVWFGIVVCCENRRAVIPDPTPMTESRLEYEIIRAVESVTRQHRLKVSVLSPLPVNGQLREGSASGSIPPWSFIKKLRETADVTILTLKTKTIDRKTTDVLLLINPVGLSASAAYAVDQYLMHGGKVIVFADPNCYYAAMAPHRLGIDLPPENLSSDIENMLKAWGVHFSSEVVAADMTLARLDPKTLQRMPCIVEPTAGSRTLNANHPATRKLRHLMLWFSAFESADPDTGIEKTVLLKTTGDAAICSKYIAHKHEDVMMRFKPDNKPKTLAALYQGKFRSAYGAVAPARFDPPRGGHLAQADSDAVLAVIGDADMLFDSFCQDLAENPFDPRSKISIAINDNQAFVMNLIDSLAGNIRLVDLRGERNLRRPFTRLHELKSDLEQTVIKSEKELILELYEAEGYLQRLREDPNASPSELERQQNRLDELIAQVTDLNSYRNRLAVIENQLIFWNIAALPVLLVLFAALFLSVVSYRRRAR